MGPFRDLTRVCVSACPRPSSITTPPSCAAARDCGPAGPGGSSTGQPTAAAAARAAAAGRRAARPGGRGSAGLRQLRDGATARLGSLVVAVWPPPRSHPVPQRRQHVGGPGSIRRRRVRDGSHRDAPFLLSEPRGTAGLLDIPLPDWLHLKGCTRLSIAILGTAPRAFRCTTFPLPCEWPSRTHQFEAQPSYNSVPSSPAHIQ